MAFTVIFFLLLFFSSGKTDNDRAEYVSKILSALEKLTDYLNLRYDELNLDGLFGLRVIEGQLEMLLEEHEKDQHKNLSTETLGIMKKIKKQATQTSEAAIDYVKRDDEGYFLKLQYVVRQPWKFFKKHRSLSAQLKWQPHVFVKDGKSVLNEEVSDRCMSELLGTSISEKGGDRCQISDDCVKIMTAKGLSGYGITHQILWSMLAELIGCTGILNSMLPKFGHKSVDDHRQEFCANNFYEMTEFFHKKNKKIDPLFQDLFLEQQFVCPSLGFYQFLTYNYLDNILLWQKPMGCYGDAKGRGKFPGPGQEEIHIPDYPDHKDKQYDVQYDVANLDKKFADYMSSSREKKNIRQFDSKNAIIQNGNNLTLITNNDPARQQKKINDLQTSHLKYQKRRLLSDISLEIPTFSHRKLLAEKVMQDGCLSHKTAVAGGALVMYLRYLIDPGPMEWNKHLQDPRELLAAKDSHDGSKHESKRALHDGEVNKHDAVEKGDNDYPNDYNNAGDLPLEDNKVEYNDKNDMNDGGGMQGIHGDANEDYGNGVVGGDDYDEEQAKNKDKQEHLKAKQGDIQDDNDYNYYRENNHHDDYNAKDEGEREAKPETKPLEEIHVIDMSKQANGEPGGGLPKQPQTPNSFFVVVTIITVVMLFVMYKFIVSRRIHIRYNPRHFNRV